MDEVRLYEMYLNEAIEERRTDLINRNEDYKNLREKFNYIMNKYPNLQFILEDREITELVVSNNVRSKGIGNMLISKMEEYFKSLGCEYILVDVFAYNDNAIKFYDKNGYHSRMYTNIKKIGD